VHSSTNALNVSLPLLARNGDHLQEELDTDLGRLWERNLGCDDGLVSDHDKEARFPYLDMHLVNFLSSLSSLQDVCNFSQEAGIGDKQILGLIAQ
jgi:asparagine synthetase B (glutamine-hydrolysing)